MTWDEALAGARDWTRRCERVSPTLRTSSSERALRGWALPLYALAGATGSPVSDLPAAWLRYRLEDHDRYVLWLCTRLQSLGHAVRPPMDLSLSVPSDVQSRFAEPSQVERLVEDPVAWAWWSHTTTEPGDDHLHSDGTSSRGSPTCEATSHRHAMIAALDAMLILDRGGWTPGTRVCTHGVPPYTSPTGRTAAEVGVAEYRAVIAGPQWALDPDHHTLDDGAPVGYWVRYRSRRTGLADTEPTGPVPADRITLDLAPQHAAMSPEPDRNTPPASEPRARHDVEPRAADEISQEWLAWASPSIEADSPADRYQAAAVTRLWQLRDRELTLAGDSTPQRVAERITIDWHYPRPPAPPRHRELRDQRQHQDDIVPAPDAPWCDTDRPLVTGDERYWLLQWLPEVTKWWTTARVRHVLDGRTPDTTLDQMRRLLANESFHEVLDIHANAGPTPEINQSEPQPTQRSGGTETNPGDVELLLVHPYDGLLATIRSDGFGPPCVDLHYNVAVLDRQLVTAALSSGRFHEDSQGRRTNICTGKATFDRHGGGSLRVVLASLRAFGRPVLPWYAPTHIRIGPDSTPREYTREVLNRLPTWVHEHFGPMLAASAM